MIISMAIPSQAVSRTDDSKRSKAGASSPTPAAIDGQWVLQSILPLLFAVGVLYAIGTATIGWGNTLNDRHSFRQSQTATTAYFLIDQPLRLAYETPVLGKPWSIPLEFPLYQWIVARIVGLFGTPLDQTGRFVSLVFFLLTTIPLYRIVRAVNVSSQHAWLPLLLFVISPFYIFWGRTFMIETTALFFSVSYLAAAMEAKKDSRWAFALVATALGSLAALVKVTTFLVYLGVVAALFAASCWQQWSREHDLTAMRARLLRLGTIVVVPFVVAVAWVKFADAVKAENPFAAAYLTGQTSNNWNYGTVEQKFSGFVWGVIVGRFPEYVGLPQLAWLLLGATLAVTLVHRRRWKETAACLAGWLLGPAVFTNVYFVHDYYANANAIFLIAAIAFAIVGLLEDASTRIAGVVFAAVAIIAAIWGHAVFYLPRQSTNSAEVLEAAEYIRSATADDSVIICLSNDWSPLVSYYARRRALNLPMDGDGKMPRELVADALARLKGEKIGAVVLVEPVLYPIDVAKEQLREAGIDVPFLNVKGLPKF
jgi:hypothetical protein